MHNSYYLLKALGKRLNEILTASTLVCCYSQNKDELVLEFANDSDEYFLHVMVRNDLSLIRLPPVLSRARKNTVELFPEVNGKTVNSVYCLPFERCIRLELSDTYSVLLKMFGNQSNIILCENDRATQIFRQKLKDDLELKISALGRQFQITKDILEAADWQFARIYPVLGGTIKRHIKSEGYFDMGPDEKWNLIQDILNVLEAPEHFYIENDNGLPAFTFFECEDPLFHSNDLIETLNEFFKRFINVYALQRVKREALKLLEKQRKNTANAITKSEQRLNLLSKQTPYRECADLIMAYLHEIRPGMTLVNLPGFETGELVTIKLKPTLSPQKNAEQYYRKAKNQSKEVQMLESNLRAFRAKIKSLNEGLNYVSQCEDLKDLRNWLKTNEINQSAGKISGSEQPFKEFRYQEFVILVGKNATNNDLLTQKYAHKDDLWLHARDVKGSHVVIRHVPGRPFNDTIIEIAAQLAAYYSKRRNDSLCPVTYTEKKFVRKPRGASPGKVIVEREKVILVKPDIPVNQQ